MNHMKKVLFMCMIICLCVTACGKKEDKTTEEKEKNVFLNSKVTFTLPETHVEYYQLIEESAGVSWTGDKTNEDGPVTYTTTGENKQKLLKEIKKELEDIKKSEETSKFEYDDNIENLSVYYNNKKKTFESEDEWLLKIIVTISDIYHCINGDNKNVECKAYDSNNAVLKTVTTASVQQDCNSEKIEIKISDSSSFVTEIWNDVFCDTTYYIENGTDSCGEKLNIDKMMKTLDKHLKTKKEYDEFMNTLENQKYKEVQEKWSEISKEIDLLSTKLKKETPKPNSKYDFDTDNFEDLMYEFSDLTSSL